MAKTYNVAVVSAGSLVGEAILDLLAKRKFPIGKFMRWNLQPMANNTSISA
jgi:Aspartate-semialdehyde dehydrogenase